ncbi:uncharacterized protein LOC101456877 [Ceratitis capitata]|uniref:(Mediterranean fruit fly) hypothetical protein n=2 Tax=Ceratitis capitata TaxID=7213 RepID=A0A811UAJ1_CERCA|nr:uncharacterized protein LOC101456877 [Ceratitis capitata]CAD6994395.1 unnamed protein product [Ceratitis capitata]
MRELSLLSVVMAVLLGFMVTTISPVIALRINAGRTTPVPTTTTETAAAATSERPLPIYINNNIPNVDVSCTVRYKCQAKLKGTTVPPRPCIRYCVKFIECPNAPKIHGTAGQCVDLDETKVRQQYEADQKKAGGVRIMEVAMIDFPCRPGFLPDDLGRCREIW